MSSRALRRLQRQQDEEKALNHAAEDEVSEEDTFSAPTVKRSTFALLSQGESSHEEHDGENEVSPSA